MSIIGLKKKSDEHGCFNYLETGTGPPLNFAHANGFTTQVYSKILNILANKHHVFGLNFCCQSRCAVDCAHNMRLKVEDWNMLADELIAFLESVAPGPVTGVGHSFGGVVTMMASIRRPEMFERLILLDPVFLEPKIARLVWLARVTGQKEKFPLAIRARKRRRQWSNREEAFELFRGKKLFENWDPEMLAAYVAAGLVENKGGVELSCSPETEAQIFESWPPDLWKRVKKIAHPCILARGEHSDVITDASWKYFAKVRPDIERVQFDGCGHLFPMQAPDHTAELILEFARRPL